MNVDKLNRFTMKLAVAAAFGELGLQVASR